VPELIPDSTAAEATQDAERGQPQIVDETLVDDVEVLVEAGERGMVLNLVAELHPADLGDLLSHLSRESAQAMLRWLPQEQAGQVLPELESARRAELLEGVSPREIADLVDHLESDDAADVLADVEDHVAEAVLPHLEDAEEVEALMAYGEETAGGLMGTELVAVDASATIAGATEAVRHAVEDGLEDLYVVFVVDSEGRLVGVLPLRRLLLSPPNATVGEVADREPVFVEADLDQEEVARVMERYDLVALPVVSSDRRLLGQIWIDDVVDVIREEAEEDIQRAAGLTGDEELSSSVLAISRGRLPWLAVGMAGAVLSGLVIRTFEGQLERAIVLATFIPLVTATGGNAAIQSAAIVVQGLTSGDLWAGEGLRRLGKELSVALLNGAVLGLALAGIVALMQAVGVVDDAEPVRLALTVGLTLLTVIVVATTNGALVPFVLQRAGVDPATSMGPFVTTLNDILGLTIYFVIAMVVYL
jgi:magnesium transporter